MNQVITFIRKEFYHVFRDSKTLLMLFGLPIVQIVLFGFALSNEIRNAKIAIFDQAKDQTSQQIINRFGASRYFSLQNNISSESQIEAAFQEGKIKMLMIIPSSFEEDLMHSRKASIQFIFDASDPNTASTLQGYANAIIMSYQQELLAGSNIPLQIIPQTRMLYNPELKGAPTFVPGVMALVLMLICVLMTSISIVKEKEQGTMEILLVSPVNPFLLIIAKAVPYLALSLVNLAVILTLSVTLLDMPINGSLFLLIAESTLLIITALALGLLISNSTANQQAAMLIAMMGMLVPTMLFTGFMFPIENMPIPLQIISHFIPSKWYYIIVKSIMIKGLGIAAIWKETLILLGMALILLFLSFKKFKTRLQ